MPARVIASCFAIVGFVAAVVTGLLAANRAETILWRALVVMGACYVVGRLVGHVTQCTLDAHIAQYKLDHPMPGDADLGEGSSDTVEVVSEDESDQQADAAKSQAEGQVSSGEAGSSQPTADASTSPQRHPSSGASEASTPQNKAA